MFKSGQKDRLKCSGVCLYYWLYISLSIHTVHRDLLKLIMLILWQYYPKQIWFNLGQKMRDVIKLGLTWKIFYDELSDPKTCWHGTES